MNARIVKGGNANNYAAVGDRVPYGDWTISPKCDASGGCSATVTSTDGLGYRLSLAGGHWRGRSPVLTYTCVGGTGSTKVQVDVDFVDPSTAAAPTTMSGRTVQHYSAGCEAGTQGTATTSLLLTRITP
jgi:hypothetical protein